MFECRVVPPAEHKIESRNPPTYTGIASLLKRFETTPPPPVAPFVPPKERKVALKFQLLATNKEKNELLAADWDPNSNPKATEYGSR